jgi:hypothetical protein
LLIDGVAWSAQRIPQPYSRLSRPEFCYLLWYEIYLFWNVLIPRGNKEQKSRRKLKKKDNWLSNSVILQSKILRPFTAKDFRNNENRTEYHSCMYICTVQLNHTVRHLGTIIMDQFAIMANSNGINENYKIEVQCPLENRQLGYTDKSQSSLSFSGKLTVN